MSLTALLLLLPTAGAGWPGVILKAPYSGTGFTLGSFSHSGPGCSNTHNFVAKQSHFNVTTGKGRAAISSSAHPCKSWTVESRSINYYVGLNSLNFTPTVNSTHHPFAFSWSLTYKMFVGTFWYNGAGTTAYASARVVPVAYLYDVTTNTYTFGTPSFINSTYISDVNSSISVSLTNLKVSVGLSANLTTSDSYRLATYVDCYTDSYVYGPTGSFFTANSALSEVTFPANGAFLKSIWY